MTLTLDALAVVLRGNPFATDRVARHGPPPPDVPAIHEAAFRQLLALAERVRAVNVAVGVTVWGEPGIGKSHLLRRFEQWATESSRAILISPISLQVPAPDLPRSLLRDMVTVIGQTDSGKWHETILFRIFEQFLHDPTREVERAKRPALGTINDYNRRAMTELAHRVPGATMDHPVVTALFCFFRSAYTVWIGRADDGSAALVLRWLSGDELMATEAFQIGLRERHAVLNDDQVLRAVAILTQLAHASGRTFVLSFDQIHILRREYVTALAKVLHELLDSCGNLLIVISEVQDEMMRLVQEFVISPASWDRLGQEKVSLNRLGQWELRQLIQSRLDGYMSQFNGDRAIADAVKRDPLFPLGTEWWNSDLGNRPEAQPRRAIQIARQRWQQLQRVPAATAVDDTPPEPPPQRSVDEIVDEAIAARTAANRNLSPNADNLVGLVRECLERCVDGPPGSRVEAVDFPLNPAKPITYHGTARVLADGRPITVALTATTVTGAKAVTSLLHRLRDDAAAPDRVLLVTDARVGLSLGNQRDALGRVYLNQLEARTPARFRRISVTADEYAELSALVYVITHADDLEIPGQTRREQEAAVVESLLRRARFRANPLLAQLLSDPPGATPA